MGTRHQVNNAVLSVLNDSKEELQSNIIEEYSKLKDKCDTVINKIKKRKNKSIIPTDSKPVT